MTSSQTVEFSPNLCPVCGNGLVVEPSVVPMHDAPCPECGSNLLLREPGELRIEFSRTNPFPLLERLDGWASRTEPRRLLLDFGNVEFLSSTVISRLMTVRRKSQDTGGKVVLCNVGRSLAEVLEITKLNRLFEVHTA